MPYRILTLDGGGSWALIEVRTLIKLYGEETTGHEVLEKFDLVAANSGGSLVLAGLIENLSLLEIANYFLDESKRRSMFSPTRNPIDAALKCPKYSTEAKLPAIERLLPKTGAKPLANIIRRTGPGGAIVKALIVGFDYDLTQAVFFRSEPRARSGWGSGQPEQITLAEAVHASTNAPVAFFDAPAEMPLGGGRYWDGGVSGCNNPCLVALVEAVNLGHLPQDVRVMSLGTGHVSRPLAAVGAPVTPFELQRAPSNLFGDLKKLAESISDDPPDAATFIVHTLTGGRANLPDSVESRVVRMNPLISPLVDPETRWKAPKGGSPASFKYMSELGMDAVEQFDVNDIDAYCTDWLDDYAPNQPISENSAVFDPEKPDIGYAKFSEARAAWDNLAAMDQKEALARA